MPIPLIAMAAARVAGGMATKVAAQTATRGAATGAGKSMSGNAGGIAKQAMANSMTPSSNEPRKQNFSMASLAAQGGAGGLQPPHWTP